MPRTFRDEAWFAKIDARLTLLISEFDSHMSDFDRNNIVSFIDAGEPGLALEGICDFILEYGYEIPEKAFEQIKNLANEMGMDDSLWKLVEKQVRLGELS